MATFTGTVNNDNITGTTGADTMIGLKGDDTYTVNNCDDTVIEADGEGKDKVNSSITYTLSDGVEILVLGGANSIDGTGNKLDNSITGNGAANRLTTGDGLDTIIGGGGNDTIMAGGFLTAADRIDGGTGTDMLVLDGDYSAQLTMSATTVIGVERIKLIDGNDFNLKLDNATNSAGLTVDGSRLTAGNTLVVDGSAETTSALTAIGGADNDTLTGGAGTDTLTGGTGADKLDGGAGLSDTASYAGSSAGVTIDLGNVGAQGGAGDGTGDILTGIEHVIGSAAGDQLTGTAANNKLTGGDGNDTLTAGAGNDTLRGDAGNDTLLLAGNLTAADTVDGGDGFDTLSLDGNGYAAGLSFGSNVLGIEEIDLTTGNSYKLTLSTTTNVGGLTVDGSALGVGNNLTLSATAETDSPLTALGGAGNDSISAGAVNDTLNGGSGNDTLLGGGGDDLFEVKGNLTALDRTDGGAGLDTLSFDGATTAVFGATTVTNIETFLFAAGSSYNLKLADATTATALTVDGSALGGADSLTIDGSLETTGKLTFFGGAGADSLRGGNGMDTFYGSAGADSMNGGGGLDLVTYEASAAAVNINLATNVNTGGDAAGDVLTAIETMIGSAQSDTIAGDTNANSIRGGEGDDQLGGGTAGNDTLFGESGNDTLAMGAALTNADKLDGGDGDDILSLDGNGYAAGLIFGATTAVNIEQITVAAGFNYNLTLNDAITTTGLIVDASALGAGNTLKLIGTAEKNALDVDGGAGNDVITGGSANDSLAGDGGNDSLTGGAGANEFIGGAGADTIVGGAGIDTASYVGSAAVTVNLNLVTQVSGGDANGDRLSAVENILGSGSGDVLTGNSVANILSGGAGMDTLDGGTGNDTLIGGSGADSITGGIGTDLASYAGSAAGVTIDLTIVGAQGGAGDGAGDTLAATIEGVIGSSANDTLTSGGGNNILNGEDGADSLVAGGGNDTISGGDDDDSFKFLGFLNGSDKVDGGDGYDTVLLAGAYGAGISLSATNFVNVDEIDLADGNNYKISIATGTVGASVFVDGGSLTTGTLSVTATGSVGVSIQGGALADTLTGGTGGDNFFGSAGADSMTGGTGVDTVDYSGSGAGVTVNLAVTTAQVSGGDASGDKLSGMENAIGSASNDTFFGTTAVNNIDGSGGDDVLRGGAGADTLVGGLGDDTADYSTSTAGVKVDLTDSDNNAGGDAAGDRLVTIEHVVGSALNDTLTGDGGDNSLDGGKGNDSLVGGAGADSLNGGAGIDTADYSAVEDSNTDTVGIFLDLTGGSAGKLEEAAGDMLTGVENVIGTAFSDEILGDVNANKIVLGGGSDTVQSGGGGNDTLQGGADGDTFIFAGDFTALDQIDGGVGTSLKLGVDLDIVQFDGDYSAGVVFGAATMTNVERIELAAGNSYKFTLNNATNANGLTVDASKLGAGETLILNGAAETAAALTATGGAGNDSIAGGGGADILTGGDGTDTLVGNAGNDEITGGAGADSMTGGTGIDTLSYAGSAAGVTVDLSTNAASGGDAAGDSIGGFENVTGSGQDDKLTGDKNANILVGGAGADTIDGGLGIDTVSYAGSVDAVVVDLGTNVNTGGDALGDQLTGIEVVIGSTKADSITGRDDQNENLSGGDEADTLAGGGGNDTLAGGTGGDELSDGDGNDSVTGDDGDDTFIAGTGNDTLKGGVDSDSFKMGGNLTALDRIDGGTSFVLMSDPQIPHEDVLVLDGDYSTLLTFAAATVVNIETIEVMDGFNYNLKLDNATNTTGLTVDASDLKAGSTLTLNGSAETTSALTAIGGDDADSIAGGGGADRLTGGAGADTLVGGGGVDTASYAGSAAAVSINLSTNVNTGGDALGDSLATIENLVGSANDDTLVGSTGNNTIEGGAGADSIDGGDGFDVASYENSGAGVTVDLSTNVNAGGDAAGDSLANIEGVIGSDSDDSITGNGSANLLTGGKGDDTINADCGNDTVNAGAGKDQIDLDHDFTALDRIDGGDGTDTLLLDGNYAAGVVFGAATLVNVEEIVLAAGNTYRFTLSDAANTNSLSIDGSALASDETLYVNGVLETSHGLGMEGGAGNDTLIGGAKSDDLSGGDGNDSLSGNTGNDDLDGGAGDDNLVGGEGSDTFTAGSGADTMNGGGGGDRFLLDGFLGGADRIDGGADTDELVLEGDYSGGVVFGATTVINIETITLTGGFSYRLFLDQATNTAGLTVDASDLGGADSLYLDGSKETLSPLTVTGGDGDDTIIGGAGSDSVVGGVGADSLRGGAGVDTLSYAASSAGVNVNLGSSAPNSGGDAAGDITNGFENLIGSAFDDTLTGNSSDNLLIGGKGADALSGGLGVDTISYAESADGVFVQLDVGVGTDGDADGDTYSSIENVIGSAESDAIYGNGSANKLEGRGGDDYIEGLAGNDTLLGGAGHDTLAGGAGADSIDGGTGSEDTASYSDSTAAVTVDLNLATAQVSGGYASGDILTDIANLIGSDFNDRLTGDSQDNRINGLAGADTITGGVGFDYVFYDFSDKAVFIDFNAAVQSGGHAQGDVITEAEGIVASFFNDRLIGNAERNALYGAEGNDTLTGGAESDIFGFDDVGDLDGNGNIDIDVVTDFQVGVGGDILHIGNILEGYNGDINDYMRIVSSGGQTVMQIDADGAAGGENFISCAVLLGVSAGTSVDALMANGQIDPFPGTV